ncbi:Bcr/CflA family multidrug efflux MFS transporter [Shewanella sp. AS1]|uniref:purine nucleoside transporter PunC n=1 Tax=Shewanella sp. AS1 TaxID=2907626 RepID=UPI001F2372E2|nr:purine nucleoside transporter PunC [Shewanella sp. AS1]MCE9678477.1 Bcr/CflA family multidrug efflux MFS transporter [Shewanella sp. AS1]
MNKSGSLLFVAYLSLLSMLGFIATDIYLPAFKAIEISFNTSPENVASTLSCFLAGLAIGQLLYGPLVQRFGKRNSLIMGLALFGFASLMVALSHDIVAFNVGRFFQAIGACSASVIWQAIVIEQNDEKSAQRIFSNIMPLVALSPALAPLVGAYLLTLGDWRTIFWVLSLLSALLIVATFLWVEHNSVARTTVSAESSVGHHGYLSMLNHPRFLGNVIIFGACSGAFFSYLTLWPIVMQQQGYQATEIGLSFIPQTLMFILGGILSKSLIKKLGRELSLHLVLGLFGLCILGIALSTLVFKFDGIWPMLFIFAVMAAANGACYPIVVNDALQQFKQDSAKAAGLQNFIQISMGFGASSLVALWAQQGKVAITIAILVCAAIVIVASKMRKLQHWQDLEQHFQLPDPANIRFNRHGGNKGNRDV